MSSLKLDLEFAPFVRVRVWQNDQDQTYTSAVNVHPGYEVSYIEAGGAQYQIGSKRVEVGPGQIILVPVMMEHQSNLSGHLCARTCWISPQIMDQVADSLLFAEHCNKLTPDLLPSSPGLVTLTRLIKKEASEKGPEQTLAVQSLTEALVIEILRQKIAPLPLHAAKTAQIIAALDQIETCFAEPLSIEDLARTAGMSRFHFSRRFREEVGQSPYQFLLERRLKQAATLLKTGQCTVTEAAMNVGFNDIGRFSQMFRQAYGCSPREYLQQHARHHSTLLSRKQSP